MMAVQDISSFFAYRAESYGDELIKYFSRPQYFSRLTSKQCCLLVGARGTGKTTVLRSMIDLNHHGSNDASDMALACYYKINSKICGSIDRILSDGKIMHRLFSHLINLSLSRVVLKEAMALELHATSANTSKLNHNIELYCLSMGREDLIGSDLQQIAQEIEKELVRLGALLNKNNNLNDASFSMLGEPLKYMIRIALLLRNAAAGSFIAIAIDEFENLCEWQQEIYNTLIKECLNENYTFKIGVRRFGYLSRKTITGQEISTPSDLDEIDIRAETSDADFSKLAKAICEKRLKLANEKLHTSISIDMDRLFPKYKPSEEAKVLGISRYSNDILEHSSLYISSELKVSFLKKSPFQRWFIYSFAKESSNPSEVYESYINNDGKLRFKLNNYGFASLYAINKGHAGYKKYFAGWNTFCLLSGGNIRFLLALVSKSLELVCLTNQHEILTITQKTQTDAAVAVGLRAFEQLSGISRNGEYLKQLVLSLGRTLQIVAQQPFNHAPELSQFELSATKIVDPSGKNNIRVRLEEGVDNLVFERSLSNKLGKIDPKTYEYRIHPIFSALFQITYRKKRKFHLDESMIELLVQNPKAGIKKLLAQFNVDPSIHETEPVPNQLSFYFDQA